MPNAFAGRFAAHSIFHQPHHGRMSNCDHWFSGGLSVLSVLAKLLSRGGCHLEGVCTSVPKGRLQRVPNNFPAQRRWAIIAGRILLIPGDPATLAYAFSLSLVFCCAECALRATGPRIFACISASCAVWIMLVWS